MENLRSDAADLDLVLALDLVRGSWFVVLLFEGGRTPRTLLPGLYSRFGPVWSCLRAVLSEQRGKLPGLVLARNSLPGHPQLRLSRWQENWGI